MADTDDRSEGKHDQEPVYDEVQKGSRQNPVKPVVNIQASRSTEESNDDDVYETVEDSYTTMSAGNSDIIPDTSPELKLSTVRLTGPSQSPESLISQPDNSLRQNPMKPVLNIQASQSTEESNDDDVYDTVDDRYTTMSAGNSYIIPDKSPELQLPTIRLTGPPQSSESLISQLDNSFKNEIRVVLIGKTGAGKSTTGNILLGKESFSTAMNPVSVTKECCRAESDIHARKLVVIDTPGLFDTELSPEEIQKEIIRCVTMSVPGHHIFLILLQVGRLTTEEISTLDQLFDIFGKNMGRFCMIVFTRIEDLEREGSTIDKFIKDGGPLLSGYIEKCSGRYFALKNPLSQEEQFQVSATLFKKINEIISKNKNKCFTNLFYRDAKER
ncbi:GTPase IMAP family member 9-like [Mytilus californianus]|uniref:GTPase IMAP family member 9-like n=1 Tax=Mytilus californianus TaxID=6549 RepID=UPI0022468570|nr:GTPase IMAP family member 9-like [Mytilus californianus]